MSCMPRTRIGRDAELAPARPRGRKPCPPSARRNRACGRDPGSGTAASSALRVRVHRVAEQLRRGRELDDAPGAHHRDAVGEVVHHREVVRDEDVGEAERRRAGRRAGSAPAPAPRRRAPTPARRRSAARGRARARARCRCAGAARRRSCAGSAAGGARRGRPAPSSPSRARSARPRRRCRGSRSGSLTMSYAVMRGLSELNGSWNTNCTLRR